MLVLGSVGGKFCLAEIDCEWEIRQKSTNTLGTPCETSRTLLGSTSDAGNSSLRLDVHRSWKAYSLAAVVEQQPWPSKSKILDPELDISRTLESMPVVPNLWTSSSASSCASCVLIVRYMSSSRAQKASRPVSGFFAHCMESGYMRCRRKIRSFRKGSRYFPPTLSPGV
jgi:hypothetical protein